MKRIALAGIAALTLALAGCSGSSGPTPGASSGTVTIQFWHAQTPPTQQVVEKLVNTFNASHPHIVVQPSSGGTSTGDLLPKVTTAIAAGTAPDIAYIYGSYAANIAQSDKTVNLANRINEPGFNWNDFYPASKQIVSPGGKVIGFPALIDNLSVIYNKKLFAAAGVPDPSPNWTWDDFRNAAKKLTNSANHIYGVNYPIGGDLLDTSWRFFPGLWQRGGQILSSDDKKAMFNSPAGIANLTLWQQMATVDHSVYLDPTASKAEPLFTSGHLAMFVSGPWEVPTLNQAKVDWADVQLPAVSGNHQTVSGPDNWVIFNNGTARVNASITFLKWLTAPQQELTWMMGSGSLPVRPSILKLPGYQQFLKKYPGIGPMAANLVNAKEAMPALPQWPRVVDALGTAIASVLLGKAAPKAALDQAAQQADAILIAPG
ncbi:MAG TPA: ABC transporter substrate-binding protein [Streptosporangiaceae bacterium]|jgi:multiple sugar transport system substrate-binding protein|nr:ABC transporter substrate-binding protein [Streptosporangiaceae bacterium]